MINSPSFYETAIQKLFLIVNKEAQTVPFVLNDPQKTILYALKGRDIILKARQEGISSLILALFTIDFLTVENIRCVVISHEANATQKLFDKVKFYLESIKQTFPGEVPYKLKYNSRNELVNTAKNSVFYIGTAGCLHPDSQVLTTDGNLKRIADMTTQDSIYRGRGRVKTIVDGTSVKPYRGKMIKMTSLGNPSAPITVTPDHRFMIHKDWQSASHIVSPLSSRGKRVCSFIRPVSDSIKEIDGFKMDGEFGWILGLYLAEGWYGLCYTNFGLHLKEEAEKEKIHQFALRYGFKFGYREKGGVGPNGMEVRIGSKSLMEFIEKHLGKQKQCPDWFWDCGKEFLNGVIDGYVTGDGSTSLINGELRSKVTSVRPQLLYQLREMLLSARKVYSGIYQLKDNPNGLGKVHQPKWELDFPITKGVKFHRYRKSSRGKQYYEYISLPVKVEEIDYDGPVYDLSCGGSFSVPSGLVHNSRAFGHGDTVNNLHVSELSRYPNQETLMIGLMQAVPKDGTIIIETTANGAGDYFYRLWQKSQSPASPFTPHFLAWYMLAEYALPCKNGFHPTEEEQELQNTYKLTHEQLNWRRYKIAELGDNVDAFNEQFPANAQEAFIVSGNPIWPPTTLKWFLAKCQPPEKIGNLIGGYEIFFEENEKGYVKQWKEPTKHHSYCIGVDVAEGIEQSESGAKSERRDYSCAYVMDRMTGELVACWHGHIDGDQLGREMDKLGRYYNEAVIGVEKNYQGLAPLVMLRDLNYPNLYYREKIGLDSDKQTPELGWRTDRFTRPMMIDEGGKWIREKRLIIYDEDLVGEMMSFVRYPDGQGRAAQGSFDDRVMSMLITLQMYVRSPMSQSGNEIERPDEGFGTGDMMEGGDSLLSGESSW